jgi:hypothetical protein
MPCKEQQKGTSIINILGSILILCSLTFVGYLFYQDHEKLVVAEHWIPTQAVIKNENVSVIEATYRGRSGSPRQDCLTGNVIYAFKGSSYEKNFLVDCKDSASKESDDQVAQQLRQIYPIDSKISIRFNPQQPEQAMTAWEFKSLSDNSIGNLLKFFLKIYGGAAIFFVVLFVVVGLPLFFYLKGGKKPPSIFDYEP